MDRPLPITVENIMRSLPPMGQCEEIMAYLRRMQWSVPEFVTVVTESRSVLIRRGFFMIGSTSDVRSPVQIHGAGRTHVCRVDSR
jgi:hypothetical protein